MIDYFVPKPSDQPVFLLASAQRCGSTLLQRVINSCPSVMMWGEHIGLLNTFERMHHSLLEWEATHASQRKTFLLEGHNNFLPNMVPEDYELWQAAAAYLLTLFGVPAAKLGKPTWGFKEVRYGARVAVFLQRCFPKARFIHLTRNIVNCFISMKRWEDSSDPWNRAWTKNSIEDWKRINASFHTYGNRISNLLTVRYEDMVAEPQAFVERLAQFLNMAPDSFDVQVFDKRIHNVGPDGSAARSVIHASDLDADEKALLSEPSLVELASEYGYRIDLERDS
jgi:hypothetical protein